MKTISRDDFSGALIVLFKEAFEGFLEKEGNVFLDRGMGIFTTLGALNAQSASIEIAETTIAAHCEHVRFYLELLNNYLHKDFRVTDFRQSWRVKTVSDTDWDNLRESLARTYRVVSETFETHDDWNRDTITTAMGMITHTAYHLGAIRQLAKSVADSNFARGN